jgi:putative transposase
MRSYAKLNYHIIFSVKHREALISREIQARLYLVIGGIARKAGGVLEEIGGMPDHVHLLISWRPDESLSSILRTIKSESSGWLRHQFPEMAHFHWQDGYSAFSVSESQKVAVTNHLQNQENYHYYRNFQKELSGFLKLHHGKYKRLIYHIVFSVKYRAPLVSQVVQRSLYPYIGDIVSKAGGVLEEIGGMSDHVHLLASGRPDESLSSLVRTVKSESSVWMRRQFPEIADFHWQDGYSIFSVSESQKEAVASYIQNQEQHHAFRSFQDEIEGFLRKHGLAFERSKLSHVADVGV